MQPVRMKVSCSHRAEEDISRKRNVADYERSFPVAFESRKDVLFHPARPDSVNADILEIGPGRGDFLFAMAEARPQKRIVAIELGKKRYDKLVKRIDQRALTNVLLIQGDARFVIPHFIPDASIEAAYILFPDPWPKRRHAFHRLLTTEFLSCLARTLKPGGILTLKTDVGAYAEWVALNMSMIPLFEVVSSPTASAAVVMIETLYEQRRQAAGETIYTVSWRRTGSEPLTSA